MDYILESKFDSRKSFYNKARYTKTIYPNGVIEYTLYSYDTPVCRIWWYSNGRQAAEVLPWEIEYRGRKITKSTTTNRHIREFLRQFYTNPV